MTKKNKKPKKNGKTFEMQQHGSQYQMKLLLLFLWRGIKNGYKFKLGTEIKAAEKFDDLVFYHKNVGEERYRVRYLQAKNSMHDNSLLKYDDFITTQYKARCNLKKYFTSFQKIKQKVIGGDIQDYIICTNIALPELVLRNADGDSLEFQEVTKMDKFFTSSDPCKWKRYKLLEQSALNNPKLKDIFDNSTNLGLLAKELAYSIYKPKTDDDDKNDEADSSLEFDQKIEEQSDNKKVNLDVNGFWLSRYYTAIKNDNIISNESYITFNKTFLDKNLWNKKFKTANIVLSGNIKVTIEEFHTLFMKELKYFTQMTEKDLSTFRLDKELINIFVIDDHRDKINQLIKIFGELIHDNREKDVTEFMKDCHVKEGIDEIENKKKFGYERKDVENLCIFLLKKLQDFKNPNVVTLNNIFDKEDLKEEPTSNEKETLLKELVSATLNFTLTNEENELSDYFLKNSALFKYIFCIKKQDVLSNDFCDGRNLNENIAFFRSQLFNNSGKHLFKILNGSKMNATTGFINLLQSTNNTSNANSVESLAEKLANHLFYKTIITDDTICQQNTELLKAVFKVSSENSVKFTNKFLKNELKNEQVLKFQKAFLKNLAAKDLKNISFQFSGNIARNPVKSVEETPEEKILEKLAAEFILKFQNSENYEKPLKNKTIYKNFIPKRAYFLLDDAFDKVTEEENIYKFKSSFFESSTNETQLIFKTILIEQIPEAEVNNIFNDLKHCKFEIHSHAQEWDINGMEKLANDIYVNSKKSYRTFMYDRSAYENGDARRIVEDVFEQIFDVQNHKISLKNSFFENKIPNNYAEKMRKLIKEKLIADEWETMVNLQFDGIKKSSSDLEANSENTVRQFIDEILKFKKTNDSNILKFEKKIIFQTDFYNALFRPTKQKEDRVRFQMVLFQEENNNEKELPSIVQKFKNELKEKILEDAMEKLKNISLDIDKIPSFLDTEGMDFIVENIQKSVEASNKKIKFSDDKYCKDGTIELLEYLSESMTFAGEKNLVKFKKSFFENQELSKGAELFKKKLKEKFNTDDDFHKLSQYFIEVTNFPLCLDEEDIRKFADELCETIKQNEHKGIYKATEETKGIIEALAESVFVCTGKIEYTKTNSGEILFTSLPYQFIKFSKQFLDTKQKQPKEAMFLREILKEKLKDDFVEIQKMLEKYEIKVIDYPFCCENMIENGCMEDNISEFCNKFLISITPSGDDLIDIVKDEIGPEINLINSNFAVNQMYREVMDWAKEIENNFLDEQQADEYFGKIKSFIASLMLAGCNSLYCKQLENLNISFENTMNILECFLEGETILQKSVEKQILQITTDEPFLTSIKVYQTLSKLKNLERDDSFIMNPLSDLLCLEERVLNAFRLNDQNDLLIIIYEDETEIPDEFCNFLFEILRKNKKKKIILISKSKNSSTSKFKKIMKNHFKKYIKAESKYDCYDNYFANTCDSFVDNSTFNNLSSETQEKMLNTELIFQGNDIYLYQLFYSNPKISTATYELIDEHLKLKERIDDVDIINLLNSNILVRLINGVKLEIGEAVKPFKNYDSEYYIQRKFNLREIEIERFFDKSVELETHVFAIEKSDNLKDFFIKNTTKFRVEFMDDDIKSWPSKFKVDCKMSLEATRSFVLLEPTSAETDFKKICEENRTQTIHWLKLCKNKLFLYYSYAPETKNTVFDLKFCTVRNDESDIFIDESILVKHTLEKKIVLIADSAGMGKSTILTSFEKALQQINKENFNVTWIVRIDLNSYTDILLEIKNLDLSEIKLKLNFTNTEKEEREKYFGKVILTCLLNHETNKTELTFENAVFNNFFEKSRMVILFDGFDEINPDYGDIVVNLLHALKNQTKNKIWVTSRPNFRSPLEKQLNVFAYDLKRFTQEEQEEFLVKLWIKKWNSYLNFRQKQRMKVFAGALIENFRDKIGKEHRDLIGIPLQTKMLAEIFQKNNNKENDITWLGCFDYIFGSENAPYFGTKIENLFELYSNFVETKIIDYFIKEKEIANLSKSYAPKLKELIRFYENELHRILSFVALKDKFQFKNFLSKEETQKMEKYIKEFKAGTENVGIVDRISNDGQILFNHLTYAEYFTACFLNERLNKSSDVVCEIIEDILNKDVPVFLYCIKYLVFQQKILQNDSTATTENLEVLNVAAKNGFLNCIKHFTTHENFLESIQADTSLMHYAVENNQTKVTIWILLYVYPLFYKNEKLTSVAHFYLVKFINYLEGKKSFSRNGSYSLLEEIKSYENVCLKPKMSTNFLTEFERIIRRKSNLDKILCSNRYYKYLLDNFFQFSSLSFIKTVVVNIEPADVKTSIVKSFTVKDDSLFNTVCGKQEKNEEKISVFDCLLNKFTDDQTLTRIRYRVLQAAIKMDCLHLFKHYFDPGKLDDISVFNLLNSACNDNNLEILKLVLPQCKKLNAANYNFRYNPLEYALKNCSSLSTIKYIFQFTKPDVNDKNLLLKVALESKCMLPTIKYLIENGAELPPHTSNFKTNDQNIIEYFKKSHGVAESENNQMDEGDNIFEKLSEEIDQIFIAVKEKNFQLFCERYKSKQTYDKVERIKDKDGRTIMHHAVIYKNQKIVNFLINEKASINVLDRSGKNELYCAIEGDDWEMAKILFCYGSYYENQMFENAKIKNKCIENLNKIGKCFELIYEDKIEEFIKNFKKTDFDMDKSVVVNICDHRGRSFFEYAQEINSYNLVIFLLQHGAFVHKVVLAPARNGKIHHLFKSIIQIFEAVIAQKYDSQSIIIQIERNDYFKTFIHKIKFGDLFEMHKSKTLLQYAEEAKDDDIINWCNKQQQ